MANSRGTHKKCQLSFQFHLPYLYYKDAINVKHLKCQSNRYLEIGTQSIPWNFDVNTLTLIICLHKIRQNTAFNAKIKKKSINTFTRVFNTMYFLCVLPLWSLWYSIKRLISDAIKRSKVEIKLRGDRKFLLSMQNLRLKII